MAPVLVEKYAEKENSPPAGQPESCLSAVGERGEAKVGQAAASASTAISEQEGHIRRFMQWWEDGHGAPEAEAHPILSLLNAAQLAEVIAAGARYHTILTADRLDALQRRAGEGPEHEALRRALQVGGGWKSQARAVGSLLFSEAKAVFEQRGGGCGGAAAAASEDAAGLGAAPPAAAPALAASQAPPTKDGAVLDESFAPPRLYRCSASFPQQAQIAVRGAPSQQSELLTSLPHGTEFLVHGRCGDFLQFTLANWGMAYVPRIIGDVEVLVPVSSPVQVGGSVQVETSQGDGQAPCVAATAPASPAAQIEERARQVGEFITWWQDGHGLRAAEQHPLLSIVDPVQLTEMISASTGYHSILTPDRIDGLLRKVDARPNSSELEPLRKALQARGGARSQARAVGTLLFEEGRRIFESLSAGGSGAATGVVTASPTKSVSSGEECAAVAGAANHAEGVPRERWSPPRIFVCSDSFPREAQIAVRAAPRQDSEMLGQLPYGTSFAAVGLCGDYLEIQVASGEGMPSRPAFVPRVLGELELLVPLRAEGGSEAPASTPATKGPHDEKASGALLQDFHTAASPSPRCLSRQSVGGGGAELRGVWEAFRSPELYVCSEHFPPGAQIAVRASPSQEAEMLGTAPHGTEFLATARCGDYLHFHYAEAQCMAFVPAVLHGVELLVPARHEGADAKVQALEALVSDQGTRIGALEAEVADLRRLLSTVAAAFAPLGQGSD